MTRVLGTLAISAALLLGGCGENKVTPQAEVKALSTNPDAPVAQFGFREATSPRSGQDAVRQAVQFNLSAVDAPNELIPKPVVNASEAAQIAYGYDFGFRVSAADLEQLQQRHVALCEAMKEDCRVLTLARSGNDDYGYGELRLQVEASEARRFGDGLTSAADGIDAERISFGISGEDLTESIIDIEAHLESRRLLRDRLMQILRTRQGSVGDLVQAERGVAEVNEEIDAATSNLAHLRGRVTFSDVSITYDPQLGEYQLGFLPPINYAVSAVGTTLGMTIAGIIYALVALIPIIAVLLLLRWLWRKSGLRIWRSKRTEAESIPASE